MVEKQSSRQPLQIWVIKLLKEIKIPIIMLTSFPFVGPVYVNEPPYPSECFITQLLRSPPSSPSSRSSRWVEFVDGP